MSEREGGERKERGEEKREQKEGGRQRDRRGFLGTCENR